jgi:hypothetical protein
MRRYESLCSRRPALACGGGGSNVAMPVIHRLAHRCEIFWNASRVQPYSRSRVAVGREGISRVPAVTRFTLSGRSVNLPALCCDVLQAFVRSRGLQPCLAPFPAPAHPCFCGYAVHVEVGHRKDARMDEQVRGIGHGYELESRGREDHVCHHAANLVDLQVLALGARAGEGSRRTCWRVHCVGGWGSTRPWRGTAVPTSR